jgi:hypothetical protein
LPKVWRSVAAFVGGLKRQWIAFREFLPDAVLHGVHAGGSDVHRVGDLFGGFSRHEEHENVFLFTKNVKSGLLRKAGLFLPVRGEDLRISRDILRKPFYRSAENIHICWDAENVDN